MGQESCGTQETWVESAKVNVRVGIPEEQRGGRNLPVAPEIEE
jgi:hypothetical protein